MGGNRKMRLLRPIFLIGCFCLLVLALAILEATPASSQGVEITPGVSSPTDVVQVTVTPTVSIESPSSEFRTTLAELGYEERVLSSPYDTADYTLRLPEGWELGRGSFFRLDFSYTYDRVGISDTQALPSLFGDIIVVVDGETQRVLSIEEPAVENSRLRINLPLLNDPARNAHSIRVILDANSLCNIPHRARLVIHTTSFFTLAYNQLPIPSDLALYPRPFYQRAFEPDQVHFVLPARPTEMELSGAVAVAAKLGDLTSRMVISGTTDLELLDRLEAGKASEQHLIVIGGPESNEVILKLNELGVLPVPLRKRQLSLAGEGPAAVVPGDTLTYILTLTNTTQDAVSSLSLVDTLPADVQMVTCSPSCSKTVEGEVSWPVSSLGVGEALSYTLDLRLSEVITDSVVENTVTLLDATSNPINVNTLTTAVRSAPLLESGPSSSVSAEDSYFFLQGERAVPEYDGIVQELVSPWDQTRAILIVTGLSDEAVYKACRAMSSESYFPGMKGPFALVREVRHLPVLPPESQDTVLTFADLGYSDRVLKGRSQEANYSFDIPVGWHLTKAAYLDLHFSHSQLLNYGESFLSVLFNNEPIATTALSDETSLNGELQVELPSSQVRPGRSNRISIQAGMRPFDECVPVDTWLLVSSESLLHLDHKEQDINSLDLDFYPYPFDRRSDLADVLFLLPPQPTPEEWGETLQLGAALGGAAGGPNLAPAVALGDTWSEAELGDYHLVAIGRPSRNLMLQQINTQLPQPFYPGSDEIEQRINDVVFRLPAGLSLGLVQLIASPWNEARAFLAVTGTTDEGVKQAMDVLADRPRALRGNLALIRDGGINTIDTRGLTSGGMATALATAVPEMASDVVPSVTPGPIPPSPTTAVSDLQYGAKQPDRPGWLIPLAGMTGLVVVAIFAGAFWRAKQRRA
jgi:uncharacterized repeat protein (TIGR01451 family)